jgi:hypothetical protein
MSLKSLFLSVLSVSLLAAAPAGAEVFFWQDAETKMSFTYPDRWTPGHTQRPDDIFSVMAPGENDHALCRLRVREDKRFVIYPEYLDKHVAKIQYSWAFWNEYLGEYDNVTIESVSDDYTGFGRGFGSYATARYTNALGPKMDKRALMIVSLYNGKAYIIECSAEIQAYPKWHQSFLSVIKSVDFRKEINEAKNGYYRNFYEGGVRVRGDSDFGSETY